MARKPMYKRKDVFTVLRQIRLTSKKVLNVGDKIESCKYPPFRLLNWYRKGMIAQRGSEYVKEYLISFNRRYHKENKINYLEELPETKVNGYYEVNTKDPQPIIQSHYQPVLAIKEETKTKPKKVKKQKRKYTKRAKK